MLTQPCNCIRSNSAYVRQSCDCDIAAIVAYDELSEAALGRVCLEALDSTDIPIVAFGRFVDAKLFS